MWVGWWQFVPALWVRWGPRQAVKGTDAAHWFRRLGTRLRGQSIATITSEALITADADWPAARLSCAAHSGFVGKVLTIGARSAERPAGCAPP